MSDTDTLIQRYLEGLLSDSEAEELLRQLQQQPQLGQVLLEHLSMDAMLRDTHHMLLENAPIPTPKKQRFSLFTLSSVTALVACATIFVTLFWTSTKRTQPEETSATEETSASVAVLTRGVNLNWETTPIQPGSPLSPGLLKLKSGIAQIEFFQGARVTLEGPAELNLISSGEATCTKGKLSAHVPPQAKGFRINTPKGNIVDLGTEFGLSIDESNTSVHVFKGEVELHQNAQPMQPVKEGQGIDFTVEPKRMAASAAGFTSLKEIDARDAQSARLRHEQWLANSERWNADPGLVLRFDFQDEQSSRSLRNCAQKSESITDGSIVGCSWTDGRWPGKHALEFRNVSDRVRLSVPGETENLTMAVWVRVAGLDRTYNSIFMSESWGERRVHWQITRGGAVRIGIAKESEMHHDNYDAPEFFTSERFGIWTHLAVVFDSKAGEVRHYANGQRVSTARLNDASPLRIGIAELGNWNDHGKNTTVPIRNLSGAMDEFALWKRVLSDDEIQSLAAH